MFIFNILNISIESLALFVKRNKFEILISHILLVKGLFEANFL